MDNKISMIIVKKGEEMKSIGKIIILMIIIIVLSFGGVYLLKLFGISRGPITKVIPFLFMVLCSAFFLEVIDKKAFSDIGLHSFILDIKYNAILLVLAFMPIVVGIIINKEFYIKKPLDITVLGAIVYCLVIGFSEELLYRGYIYNTITVYKLKIIISALAFAGFHFISPEFNIVLFVFYFIYGAIKAYIFKMIKSLWPLIIFHMSWDLGATYTDYYSNPIIGLVCLGITILIIKLIVITRKNRYANYNQ